MLASAVQNKNYHEKVSHSGPFSGLPVEGQLGPATVVPLTGCLPEAMWPLVVDAEAGGCQLWGP